MQRSAREVSKGIRVLIVDSTEMWRTGICLSMLDQADLTVVGDFDSAEAALAQLEQLSPDVAVVGADLSDGSGYDACVRIGNVSPQTRVVMASLRLSEAEIFAAMSAGASGFVPLDASVEDLIRVVRANGKGEMLHLVPVARLVMSNSNQDRKVIDVGALTTREQEILILMAGGLNYDRVASTLSLSPNTVRAYARDLFGKLNISRRTDLGSFGGILGSLPQLDDRG